MRASQKTDRSVALSLLLALAVVFAICLMPNLALAGDPPTCEVTAERLQMIQRRTAYLMREKISPVAGQLSDLQRRANVINREAARGSGFCFQGLLQHTGRYITIEGCSDSSFTDGLDSRMEASQCSGISESLSQTYYNKSMAFRMNQCRSINALQNSAPEILAQYRDQVNSVLTNRRALNPVLIPYDNLRRSPIVYTRRRQGGELTQTQIREHVQTIRRSLRGLQAAGIITAEDAAPVNQAIYPVIAARGCDGAEGNESQATTPVPVHRSGPAAVDRPIEEFRPQLRPVGQAAPAREGAPLVEGDPVAPEAVEILNPASKRPQH